MSDKAKTNKSSDTRPARARYKANDQRNKNKDRRVVRDSKRVRLGGPPNLTDLSREARRESWRQWRTSTPSAEPLTMKEAREQRGLDQAREATRTPNENDRAEKHARNAASHPAVIRSAR